MPLREHLPKTAHKKIQSSKAGRRVNVRPRRSIKPRHDELVDADPVVLDCFEMLQTAWRHQRIKHRIAPQRCAIASKQNREAERKAFRRLARYLGLFSE
jgi:hypothetical protein